MRATESDTPWEVGLISLIVLKSNAWVWSCKVFLVLQNYGAYAALHNKVFVTISSWCGEKQYELIKVWKAKQSSREWEWICPLSVVFSEYWDIGGWMVTENVRPFRSDRKLQEILNVANMCSVCVCRKFIINFEFLHSELSHRIINVKIRLV